MRVLLLGDSHTYGTYGRALQALFEAAGHQVTRVGVGGVTAGEYISGAWKSREGQVGDFPSARQKTYDLIIVSLGTNDARYMETRLTDPVFQHIVDYQIRQISYEMKELTKSLSGTRLYWVSPPAVNAVAAKKYAPVKPGHLDLNERLKLVRGAINALYGNNVIDPQAVTQPYADKLGNEIHFGKKAGAAWAKYVFDRVNQSSDTRTLAEKDEPRAESKSSGMGLVFVLAAAFILYKFIRKSSR